MQRLGPASVAVVFALAVAGFASPWPNATAQSAAGVSAPSAASTRAASPVTDFSEVGGLQLVDPGHSDVSPLAESIWRDLRLDLRAPSGFQSIYQVPGRDDLFMRASGGVFAVFPRSDYGYSEDEGVFPLIPPDTVFYLSPESLRDLADDQPSSAGAPALRTGYEPALDTRIETRIDPHAVTAADRLGAGPIDPRIDFAAPRSAPFAPLAAVRATNGQTTKTSFPAAPPRDSRSDAWPTERPWRDPDVERGPSTDRRDRFDGPALVSDPDYRARRLRFLMRQAAEASLAQ